MPSKEERAKAQAEADAAAKNKARRFVSVPINAKSIECARDTQGLKHEPSCTAFAAPERSGRKPARCSTDEGLEKCLPPSLMKKSPPLPNQDLPGVCKPYNPAGKTEEKQPDRTKGDDDAKAPYRNHRMSHTGIDRVDSEFDHRPSKPSGLAQSEADTAAKRRARTSETAQVRREFEHRPSKPGGLAQSEADTAAKRRARTSETAQVRREFEHRPSKPGGLAQSEADTAAKRRARTSETAQVRREFEHRPSKPGGLAQSEADTAAKRRARTSETAQVRREFEHRPSKPGGLAQSEADTAAKRRARTSKIAQVNNEDVKDAMDVQEQGRESSSAAVAVAKNCHDIDVSGQKISSSTKRTGIRKQSKDIDHIEPEYFIDDEERSVSLHSREEVRQSIPGAFAVRGPQANFIDTGGDSFHHSKGALGNSKGSLGDLTKLIPVEKTTVADEEGLIEAFVVKEPEYVPQVMAVSETSIKRKKRMICLSIGAFLVVNIAALAIIQPNGDSIDSYDANLFEEDFAIAGAQLNFIPGTQNTVSGYDNELGRDAVCWEGRSKVDGDPTFPGDPLVKDFVLDEALDLFMTCPNGINVQGFAPKAFGAAPRYDDGIRPLTGETYDYYVSGTLDLEHLNGSEIVSDKGSRLAIQVVLCELGKVGFCSPFVHEQTNARLESLHKSTAKPDKGDRHGGSHVHSGYVYYDVTSNTPIIPFNVSVPIVVNDPGDFFAVVAVTFYTRNTTDEETKFRYDVSNAFDKRLIFYQDPPHELKVTTSVKAITSVWIGLSSLAISFFLIQGVKYRSEVVMAKSRGGFLFVFMSAALSASVTSFLLIPKSDVRCKISLPLVATSLQIVNAILIAQLWRIHKTTRLLGLDGMSYNVFADSFISLIDFFAGWRNQTCPLNKETSQKKQKVTSTHLTRAVMFFTVPQILLQILSSVLQPQEFYLALNDDESIGRAGCRATDSSGRTLSNGQSIKTYGILFMALTSILAFVLSNHGKNLPSLFNEAEILNEALLTSTLLLFFGLGMILVLDKDSMLSPNVEYIIWIATISSAILNLVVRIMLPKLRIIWRGDTIVLPNEDLIDCPCAAIPKKSLRSVNLSESKNDFDNEESGVPESEKWTGDAHSSGQMASPDPNQNISLDLKCPSIAENIPIVVSDDEAPPRSLLLRMIDHEHLFRQINTKIMAGEAIPHELWKRVHSNSKELGDVFGERVEFSWEINQNTEGDDS